MLLFWIDCQWLSSSEDYSTWKSVEGWESANKGAPRQTWFDAEREGRGDFFNFTLCIHLAGLMEQIPCIFGILEKECRVLLHFVGE